MRVLVNDMVVLLFFVVVWSYCNCFVSRFREILRERFSRIRSTDLAPAPESLLGLNEEKQRCALFLVSFGGTGISVASKTEFGKNNTTTS